MKTGIILLFIYCIFSVGCSVTSLQRVELEGMPAKRPPRITEKGRKAGDFEVRGFLSKNVHTELKTQVPEHTNVNADGEFEVEPIDGTRFREREGVNIFKFDGDNFVWQAPEWQGGIELDFPISHGVALTGLLSYATINDTEYWNRAFGVGFFNDVENWSWRIDLNLGFSSTSSTAQIVQSERSFGDDGIRHVRFFEARDENRYHNFALIFTANTNRPNSAADLFFNYSLGWQRLYDYREDFPEAGITGRGIEFTPTVNVFSGGIFFDAFNTGRLVLGGRITLFSDEGEFSMPDLFVQYDFKLN